MTSASAKGLERPGSEEAAYLPGRHRKYIESDDGEVEDGRLVGIAGVGELAERLEDVQRGRPGPSGAGSSFPKDS